jgi:hypothetical protein
VAGHCKNDSELSGSPKRCGISWPIEGVHISQEERVSLSCWIKLVRTDYRNPDMTSVNTNCRRDHTTYKYTNHNSHVRKTINLYPKTTHLVTTLVTTNRQFIKQSSNQSIYAVGKAKNRSIVRSKGSTKNTVRT